MDRSVGRDRRRRLGWALIRTPCDEGQHNWKIDDDYDLACTMSAIELVALPDRAGFRAEMVEVDRAPQAGGWEPDPHSTMARVLEDYWDAHGPDDDGYDPAGSSPLVPRPISMDNLPQATYRRVREGRTQGLTLSELYFRE